MNDEDISRIVGDSGDDMPDTTKQRVASAISAAMRSETHAHGLPEAGQPSEAIPLQPLRRVDSTRRRRGIAVGGVVTLAAALVAVLVMRARYEDDAQVADFSTTPADEVTTSSTSTQTTTPESGVNVPPSTDPRGDVTVVTPTTLPNSTAPTTTVPLDTSTTTPPVPEVLAGMPTGLSVFSASFSAVGEVWVVGYDAATGGPPQLLHTTDSGATWAHAAGPADIGDSLYTIDFADGSNGWIVGTTTDGTNALFSTHDHGQTWSHVVLTGDGTIYPMSAHVDAFTATVHVVALQQATDTVALTFFSSPAGTDAFTESALQMQPGAGPVYQGRAVFARQAAPNGATGWYVYNDRLFTDAARLVDGAWEPWSPPCSGQGETAEVADIAVSADGATLAVACSPSGFAGTPGPAHIVVSRDGGDTFTPAEVLPALSVGVDAPPTTVSFVAVPAGDTIVVGYNSTDGVTTYIERSTDGGGTWSDIAHPEAGAIGGLIGFNPNAQDLLVQVGDASQVMLTTDGGQSWAVVPQVPTTSDPGVGPPGRIAIDLDAQTIAGFDTLGSTRPSPDVPTPEQALAAITPVLGQPELDTGWYDVLPLDQNGELPCGVSPRSRLLVWGELSMLFGATNNGTGGALIAWQDGGSLATDIGLATPVAVPEPHQVNVSADGFAIVGSNKWVYDTTHPGFFSENGAFVHVVADDARGPIARIGIYHGC